MCQLRKVQEVISNITELFSNVSTREVSGLFYITALFSDVSIAEGSGRGRFPPLHPPGLRRLSLPLTPQDRVRPTKKGL